MPNLVPLLADSSSNLLAARNQMGFTLGFHIILACLGVAFPLMMLLAEWHGHRKNDKEALRLARNWSKAVAVLFAVGAVTGTVLSFEFGLLWPRFTGRFGDAFGIAFAIEGIFFFLEAIFIAVYIYGWDRLSPRAHMLSAIPIVISGIGGAFSVIAANAWMNQPQGFDLDAAGNVTNVRPFEVLFNPATGYEFFHMFLAAYMVTGFLVASVYAVGMLRGRRDRYHRLGFIIPFTVAAIATPVQMLVGDTLARWVYNNEPTKFAAIELVPKTSTDVSEVLLGHLNSNGQVVGGIKIPGLASWLSDPSTGKNTVVQ
ncbi:MAG TPA: cytochrome ubiquinol oxidase subunit I, partial [Myxococcaceae bacterium]|nr:cytochrome ubiquinol oxidase subunit I [Myxococcaceae bacterium]